MRSIADVYVFKTPFQSAQDFARKFARIEEMFRSYADNAGMWLVLSESENDHYFLRTFRDDNGLVEISYAYLKDLSQTVLAPAWIATYRLDDLRFEKANIEFFLNDCVGFFSNVFFDEYFLEVDSAFALRSEHAGKKLDSSKLAEFDLSDPKSAKNKQLLDSLLYLYYTLIKGIEEIESGFAWMDRTIAANDLAYLQKNVELARNRQEMVRQQLIQTAIALQQRLQAFLLLIS